MKYRRFKIVIATFAITLISGCGGSESMRANDSEYISGGTEFAPATMSLEQGNKVVENFYYNYFAYQAKNGENLSIESILKKGITDSQRENCQENSETFIVVYDEQMVAQEQYKTCSSNMSVEFTEDGRYIFQIKYPGNLGHFNASLES